MADRNRYRWAYNRTDVCTDLGFGPEPFLVADSDPDDEQERYSRGRADQVHGGSVGFRALIGPSKGIQKDTGSNGPQEVLWEDGSADELTLVLHKLKYYVETHAERCCQFDISDALVDLVCSHDLGNNARLKAEISTRS